MSQVNGNQNYFNMVVSSSSRREVVRTHIDTTVRKALDPVLKRWGYRDISKVTPQLRYYQLELKPETMAGDTAGMEVFIKTQESPDRILEGFHPFINKSSLKNFTQQYLNINGWYFTRESSTGDGQLSLAVTFCQQLRHFKINFCQQEGTYKIASKSFENLHQLFNYYAEHPLKKTQEGQIYLLHPILGDKKAEDESPKPATKPPHPVPNKPQPSHSRPLPPLPPHLGDPAPSLPQLPAKPINTHVSDSLLTHGGSKVPAIDPTNRPLPALPPSTQQASKQDFPPKKNTYNSKNGLHTPDTLDPSFIDRQKKNNFLTLSPRVSPVTNCDNSPPIRLAPVESKPSPKLSPSPTPVNPNNLTNGNPGHSEIGRVLRKRESFKNQNPNPTNSSPAPDPPQAGNLPHPWTQVYSTSQRRYYYFNSETSVTSWKHPLQCKESFASSKQDVTLDNKPSHSISSTELSGRTPMRQRSQSSIDKHRPPRKTASPDRLVPFSPVEAPEVAHTNSNKRDFHKFALPPPQPSGSPPIVKSKHITANKPKSNELESPYDILPVCPPSNHVSAQLKSNRASKNQDPRGSGKHSNPISSSQPAPVPNSTPTGKPVRAGRYTIPAPPPNIPPDLSGVTPSSARASFSSKSKSMTLPHKNSRSSRDGLMTSIQGFQQHQLRSVTPDRRPVSPVEDNITLLGILKTRLQQRSEIIQDSDQSDSSYEDADGDW